MNQKMYDEECIKGDGVLEESEDGTKLRPRFRRRCDMDVEMLIREAMEALKNSYAPYSGYNVGAALLTERGRVFRGCNIENAAFSPTNCAERTAFFKAVSEGERHFKAICIVGGKNAKNGAPITDFAAPCGVCRQVMLEFCDPDTFRIILAKNEDLYEIHTLRKLIPRGFGPSNLGHADKKQ